MIVRFPLNPAVATLRLANHKTRRSANRTLLHAVPFYKKSVAKGDFRKKTFLPAQNLQHSPRKSALPRAADLLRNLPGSGKV
jgi:hypothetical protein